MRGGWLVKIAIMQPYFFPYIGYWHLMRAVDCFVVFDDVNFIQRGWINRNRILVNGKPSLFTMPLDQASQNRRICDITICSDVPWREKLLKTVSNTYRRAPYYSSVIGLIENVISNQEKNLSRFLCHQLHAIASYLGIDAGIKPTSRAYGNASLQGQYRIIDICKKEKATVYLNPPGGKALYDPQLFKDSGLDLHFVTPLPVKYPQFVHEFVPWLSIIDVMMFNSQAAIVSLLDRYCLE